MATPVLFTVELFPWNSLKGSLFEDAVREFNDELRTFFGDKVELVDIPHDSSNLTETDTVYGAGTEQEPYVAATVVIGFKGTSPDEAQALADRFTETKFNRVSAEVVREPATADPATPPAPPQGV